MRWRWQRLLEQCLNFKERRLHNLLTVSKPKRPHVLPLNSGGHFNRAPNICCNNVKGQEIKQLVPIKFKWYVDCQCSSKIETKTSVGWNEFWNEFWQLSNYLCADNRFIWLQWETLFQVNQLIKYITFVRSFGNAWRWKISSACHKKVLSRIFLSQHSKKGAYFEFLGPYFSCKRVPYWVPNSWQYGSLYPC